MLDTTMDTLRTLFTIEEMLGMRSGKFSVLVNLKFFEPNSNFLAWMAAKFDGKHIYDVGAGVGHVAKALTERGLRVTAIDINYREDPEFPVMLVNAGACGYEKGSVVMLCRPCHGIFPETVLEQALRCKVGAIVYVGLPKNTASDLGKLRRKFKTGMTHAGENGERVYVMTTEYLKGNEV